MKKTFKILAALALTLCIGCGVTSVYPFYTAQDLVFEPSLTGTWAEAKNAADPACEKWRFEKIADLAYKLTSVEKDKQTEFDAHLLKLKDQLFLDLCARDHMDDSIPPHYLFKIARLEPTLDLAMINYDWLKKLIEKDPKAIRHLIVAKKPGESSDGDLVLTANTKELQKFILKHAKTEGAFDNLTIMKRWTE